MLLIALASTALIYGCSKHAKDAPLVTPTQTVATAANHAKDQFDVAMMLTSMVTNITMLQSALAKKTGAASTSLGQVEVNTNQLPPGWNFNGMGLGKPEDLFCGADIKGTADDQNYYVNVGYNGPDCSGLFLLKGTVILSVPKVIGWNLATRGQNGLVYVNLNHINVTRIADSQHISITGIFSLVYYNKDTLYEPDLVASVEELKRLKDPHKSIQQGIQTSLEDFAIHYDDGTKITWKTNWTRFYRWDGQLIITQTGAFYDGPSRQHWTDQGTDRQNRPFHWISDWVTMYENCHYKVSAGTMSLQYGDVNPRQDSASVVFGTDRDGNSPSEAVREGHACLDSFYLRLRTFSEGQKTFDMLFPE